MLHELKWLKFVKFVSFVAKMLLQKNKHVIGKILMIPPVYVQRERPFTRIAPYLIQSGECMMRNQGQFYLGIVIVVFGVVLLIANIFDINLSILCWPMAFILLGVFLIYRPRMVAPGTQMTQRFLGEVRRSGQWQVVDEEFWYFVGDIELDMLNADIADGVTEIRTFGFVGDIDIYVPAHVGVVVDSTAFVSEVGLPEAKEENFLAPVHMQTDNYKMAQKKILLQTTCFVGDIKVRQVG